MPPQLNSFLKLKKWRNNFCPCRLLSGTVALAAVTFFLLLSLNPKPDKPLIIIFSTQIQLCSLLTWDCSDQICSAKPSELIEQRNTSCQPEGVHYTTSLGLRKEVLNGSFFSVEVFMFFAFSESQIFEFKQRYIPT